jgi:hypothetical protein
MTNELFPAAPDEPLVAVDSYHNGQLETVTFPNLDAAQDYCDDLERRGIIIDVVRLA